MGYLARVCSTSDDDLRRAMMYGSALGSFAVEKFGVERLIDVAPADVHKRVRAFRDMTAFEQPLTVGANDWS